ncbi:MAG: hypothetical protein VX228_11545, partial [Pseudomonadota bacterium]|nr:hypothetical protein [Pseudomonadota bacterium]
CDASYTPFGCDFEGGKPEYFFIEPVTSLLRIHGPYANHTRFCPAEKICTIYLAHPVRRHSDPLEPGHSAHWLPIEEAVTLLGNPGDRHFVAKLL